MSSLPIYLILGHGTEKIVNFNEREQLPDGYNLITYSEAGNASYMEEVCRSLEIFNNPELETILTEPIENKLELEHTLNKTIHIYKPGNHIPELMISPMSYWSFSQGVVDYYQFIRSGVYKFPIQDKTFSEPFYNLTEDQITDLKKIPRIELNLEQCSQNIMFVKKKDFNKELLTKLYEGSLYPSKEQLDYFSSNFNPHIIGNRTQISLKNLMKQLGPGTYYYIICRSDSEFYGRTNAMIERFFGVIGYREAFEDENYLKGENLKLIKNYENAMENAGREILRIRDTKNMLRSFIKFLQNYPNNIPEYEELPEKYKEFLADIMEMPDIKNLEKYIQSLETTRRLSIHQQQRGGTRRKSKKNTKKYRSKTCRKNTK
jgi:hypothetical protein